MARVALVQGGVVSWQPERHNILSYVSKPFIIVHG